MRCADRASSPPSRCASCPALSFLSCVVGLAHRQRNVASPESAAFASCVRTRWAEKVGDAPSCRPNL
eukprot:5819899-Pleurochrysis_carterae.AAC.2